jgi:hypothetical protein
MVMGGVDAGTVQLIELVGRPKNTRWSGNPICILFK